MTRAEYIKRKNRAIRITGLIALGEFTAIIALCAWICWLVERMV